MRFMHWGRNTLEVLCFSPCESPLFFLLLDTRHSGRRGKKNTLCTLRVSGEVARIRRLSLTRILTPANCRKVFGNVWLKRGDVSFCLVWGGEPSVWWSPHRPQREGNYSFVLQKEPVNVKCSSCPTSLGLFFLFFPPCALAALAPSHRGKISNLYVVQHFGWTLWCGPTCVFHTGREKLSIKSLW